MMIRTVGISLFIFALMGVGCTNSQRPRAVSYPLTEMQRMQSAQHWDVLAEHLSDVFVARYGQLPSDIKRTIYVDEIDHSIFSKSLKSLLVTHLVNKGIPISASFDRAADDCWYSTMSCKPLRMKLDIQTVRHDGKTIPFSYTGVSLPKIASYVIYLAGDYWTSPIWSVLPLSEYVKNNYPAETNTEVLVNTSLLNGDDVVFADSSIYYVNDVDKIIYQSHRFDRVNTNTIPPPSVMTMRRAAIAAAALDGRCETGSGLDSTAKLIQQGARMETYEVQCRKSKLTIRCEEYNSCHVVY